VDFPHTSRRDELLNKMEADDTEEMLDTGKLIIIEN